MTTKKLVETDLGYGKQSERCFETGQPNQRKGETRGFPMVYSTSSTATMKVRQNRAVDAPPRSSVVGQILRDVARTTKLNRAYVAICTVSCVSVLALLLARMFLVK